MSNKCDHNKKEFKQYERPANYKTPPTQITNLITALLRAFKVLSSNVCKVLNGLLKSNRVRRSERREVYEGVMTFLINHYDFMTSKISRFTLTDMAHWCGFSTDRVEAAVSDLEKAGFLDKKVIYAIKGPNQIKTQATEITIRNYFFDLIGYSHAKLEEARTHRRKKEFQENSKKAIREENKIMRAIKNVMQGTTEKTPQEKAKKAEDINHKKNIAYRAMELARQGITSSHPDFKRLVGYE